MLNNFFHASVNPYDTPKINHTLLDGPSGHDDFFLIFFLNNSANSGRSGGRSGQFCLKTLADTDKHLQTVCHDRTRLHRGMACSQGFNFLLKEKVSPYSRST